MSRRYFSSTYVPTTITSGINATDVTITVAASSGVPASLPWTGVLERGTSNEDLVTVTAVSGTTYTIARGIDGQSGKSHLAGASFDHVVSARDFDEPNAHVNDTTLDQHTQYGLFKKGIAALIGAAGRAGKMYYKTDLDYLTYDDGSAFHDFQSKAVADAAYQPLTTVAVRTFATGAQTIPATTETVVSFDGETFDTDAFHDNVTNNSRMTVPTGKAGKYLVTASVGWAVNATGRRYCGIKKNGANVAYGNIIAAGGGDTNATTVTDIVTLAAGDYVEVFAAQTSGGGLLTNGGTTNTYFAITRLGA